MNTTMKLGGSVVAVGAVCCAVSIVPALLAGATIAAGGAALWAWGGGALALAAVASGVATYLLNRKPRGANKQSARQLINSAKSEGCGCGPSGGDEVAIACTLDAGDFKERTGDIRDLARRSLRHASRKPLSLTLTYDIEAADEVRALVAKERECCPFLTFGVRESADTIEVAILAPAAAAEAADALFDHFAPELAASRNKEIA
jgi:hypothetical protein